MARKACRGALDHALAEGPTLGTKEHAGVNENDGKRRRSMIAGCFSRGGGQVAFSLRLGIRKLVAVGHITGRLARVAVGSAALSIALGRKLRSCSSPSLADRVRKLAQARGASPLGSNEREQPSQLVQRDGSLRAASVANTQYTGSYGHIGVG